MNIIQIFVHISLIPYLRWVLMIFGVWYRNFFCFCSCTYLSSPSQIWKNLHYFLLIKENVFLMRINYDCCKPRRWVDSRSRNSPDRNYGGGCCIYGGGGSSSQKYFLHQGNSLRVRSSYLSKSRSRRWPVDLCSTVKSTLKKIVL